METMYVLPLIFFIFFVVCFAIVAFEDDTHNVMVAGVICLVAFLLLSFQGLISYDAAKREAVKTGNAYYKQIIDKNGNPRNEFHWRVEKKKKCDCEKCKNAGS
jgi:hypothetical protein